MFQTTPSGRYLSANAALARIYGYDSPAELIEQLSDIDSQLYVNPSRRGEFIRDLQTGEVSDFESQVFRRDRGVIWISENAWAVRDAEGAVKYYEGTVQDITARKEAEQELRKSEEKWRSLVEHSGDIII